MDVRQCGSMVLLLLLQVFLLSFILKNHSSFLPLTATSRHWQCPPFLLSDKSSSWWKEKPCRVAITVHLLRHKHNTLRWRHCGPIKRLRPSILQKMYKMVVLSGAHHYPIITRTCATLDNDFLPSFAQLLNFTTGKAFLKSSLTSEQGYAIL